MSEAALEIVPQEEDEELPPRPKTRAECAKGPRPCPWISCKYHLMADKVPGVFAVRTTRRHRAKQPEQLPSNSGNGRPPRDSVIVHNLDEAVDVLLAMPRTCALDFVEPGGLTLDETSTCLSMTREAARLHEYNALQKLGLDDFHKDRPTKDESL